MNKYKLLLPSIFILFISSCVIQQTISFAIQENSKEQVLARGDTAIPIVTMGIQYPKKALMQGISGHVKVSFTISTDGTPKDILFIEEQPQGVFESSVLKSLPHWRFRPDFENGKPLEHPNAIYTIIFNKNNIN